MLAAEL